MIRRDPTSFRAISKITVTLEMIKFSHSVFALPFALVGLLLAGRTLPGGWPYLGQVVLVIICMVAARSVAMTFNRIVDLHIDARNPRTAGRALPAGLLSVAWAWGFLIFMAMAFLAGCSGFWLLYGNPWPVLLALPALLLICSYSYSKRFTSLSHFWLGLAIGISPAAAWLAVNPASMGWTTLLLCVAVCSWIAGFDIIYALQDVEFDRREGLFSLPARFGEARALTVSRMCHLVTVLALVSVGLVEGLGLAWWVGVAVAAGLLAWEQSLVSPDDLSRIDVAFFTVNGLVSILVALALFLDLLVARIGLGL